MLVLIAGLVVFLGAHSLRIVADDWRTRQIAARGERAFKGVYSIVSAVGLVLIVWGYGLTRAAPVDLWNPPAWTRPVAVVLMALSFVLFTAAYVRGTRIKAMLGHPMVLGTKAWAFAHLLSNGRLGDVLLFGAFLVWSVLSFRAARQRDRAAGRTYPAGPIAKDVTNAIVGLVVFFVFARYLHGPLFGVQPLG
jgi:uncharacterized membrane protein